MMDWQRLLDEIYATWVPDRALADRLRAEIPGWVTPRRPRKRTLKLRAVREAVPGPRLGRIFRELWPGYRSWYVRDGQGDRPTLAEARQALEEHMPELVLTWTSIVEVSRAEELAATMLTMYRPPALVRGCSQVALPRDGALLRNYDYDSNLFDGIVLSSRFTGRNVIGMSDQLWGLLDGVNEAGLAASLTFGGRREVGPGFGLPVVMRYLLETCATVQEAVAVLHRLPIHLAYNITLVDRQGDHATVFVGPDRPARVVRNRATTNHQGTVDWPAHAEWTRSVERLDLLDRMLERSNSDADDIAAAMLRAPLRATDYDSGFGTLYTAVYRPAEGSVEYRWPGSAWRLSFADFPEEGRLVNLGFEIDHDAPEPVRLSRRQILEEVAAHRMTPEAGAQLLDAD
jgi:predicted choloylglycine hydrolase